MTLVWELIAIAVLAFAFGWLACTLAGGRRLARLRQSQDSLHSELAGKEAQIVTLGTRVQHLEARAAEESGSKARAEAALAAKDREIEAAQEQARVALNGEPGELTRTASRLVDLEHLHAYALASKESDAAAWEARANELIPRLAWLAEESQAQLARIEILERRAERLIESEREARSELASVREELSEAVAGHELAREQSQSNAEEVNRLNQFVSALEPLSAQLAEAERDLTSAVEAKNSEIERLGNHVRQLEAALASAVQQGHDGALRIAAADLRATVASKDQEIARLGSQARGLEEAMKSAVAQRDSDIARLTSKVRDLESALRSSNGSAGPAEADLPALRAQKEIRRFLQANPVEFSDGTASLAPNGYRALDQLAGLLGRFDGLPLEISSHTDNVGDFWQNYQLSTWRASAVRDYLAYKGVPESRLVALGCGSTRPVDTNDTLAGRQANRRVEVRVRTEALDL